jgi:hypothetical protein
VALKLIAPELAEDERFRERFLKEPRLAASLDHPNVIPIYEAGEREGHLYLAMRYVEGSDLRTLLGRDRRLPPERALRVPRSPARSTPPTDARSCTWPCDELIVRRGIVLGKQVRVTGAAAAAR